MMAFAEQRATDGGTLLQRLDFEYDVFGNRIEKSVTTGSTTVQRFSWDGRDIWADLDGSSSLTTRRVFGDGVNEPIARIAGSAEWYLQDRMGSVRDVVNSAGAVVAEATYDAWGLVTGSSGTTDRYLAFGYQLDAESGLYYVMARYMDPVTHLWVSQDPLGLEPDANPYRYVGNGPTNATDPSGLYVFAANPQVWAHWRKEFLGKDNLLEFKPVDYLFGRTGLRIYVKPEPWQKWIVDQRVQRKEDNWEVYAALYDPNKHVLLTSVTTECGVTSVLIELGYKPTELELEAVRASQTILPMGGGSGEGDNMPVSPARPQNYMAIQCGGHGPYGGQGGPTRPPTWLSPHAPYYPNHTSPGSWNSVYGGQGPQGGRPGSGPQSVPASPDMTKQREWEERQRQIQVANVLRSMGIEPLQPLGPAEPPRRPVYPDTIEPGHPDSLENALYHTRMREKARAEHRDRLAAQGDHWGVLLSYLHEAVGALVAPSDITGKPSGLELINLAGGAAAFPSMQQQGIQGRLNAARPSPFTPPQLVIPTPEYHPGYSFGSTSHWSPSTLYARGGSASTFSFGGGQLPGYTYSAGGWQPSTARSSRMIPGTPGTVVGGSSTTLGRNMMESMGLLRTTQWIGYQAQHIIPSELASHPVLVRIGMNLDHASNGIFLPTPDKEMSPLSRHRGYHSVYNTVVERQLDRMDPRQSVAELEAQVHRLQQRLKYLQQQGTPLYPRTQGATVELWERLLDQ